MDSDDTRLERLINQCKSNDVDVKVDALTKLQAEFESGIEINDPDGLLNVLKACLRTPNQHLTTATLASLPPLLPLLVSRSVGQPQPSSSQPRSPSSSTSSINPAGVVDAATLRQVLSAFLPTGGVIERLGDKEKAQIKARETLVILGGLAFRTGSGSAMSAKSRDKGPETPLMIFERYMREAGLGSKVWKVKEQSILTLVHIRRAHHQFPMRPYLSLLVDCLEDTDAHVRDCARLSVVELFTGPGVTDGARADLKKEMTKKGVRKTIVDGVLSKLLGGSINSNPQSRDGSENGDATSTKPKDYIPPSLALQGRRPTVGSQASGVSRTASHGSVRDISRPNSRAAMAPPSVASSIPQTPTSESTEIQPVYVSIQSHPAKDLESEFAAMLKPFEGKETEHNWAARERAVLRVRGMLKGDVHLRYLDVFLISLKDGFIQWSLKTLASLRTTVSANTSFLYSELAIALGTAMDPFCDTLLTNLLKMAGFTKKIAAQQSQASVTAIINHTSPQPRMILTLLWNTLQEKTVQTRAFVVAHLKQYVEVHGHRAKNTIEGSGGLDILEKSLKKALVDANPAVRENARILFWVFEEVWADRGLALLDGLDSIARKQIEKVCPKPELLANLPPTTPKNVKKTSVAAAIAASRAKAKAIATAPPTLRHQATSGSHVPPVRRAASPATSSRTSPVRPVSPLRMSSSPPTSVPMGRARPASGTMARSVSSTAAPTSHSRSPSSGSSGSGRAATPPSPSEHSTFRRRASSPLATSATSVNRPSTIRKALQTPLPASSPSSVGHASPTPRNTNGSARNAAVPIPIRDPRLSFQMMDGDDESLLMAQAVPIPDDDSDSEGDHSINLMSFSAPYEMYPPVTPKSRTVRNSMSPRSIDSKPTVSNALSSGSVADMASDRPVVEDALRARAEQAESAAERLLELVDPEEDGLHHSTIPPSLLVGSSNGHALGKPKIKPTPLPITQNHVIPPVTPVNRNAAIMRQAAMFKDSPARNGQSSTFIDILHGKKHETGWWLKRKALVAQGTPIRAIHPADKITELQGYIAALVEGEAGVQVLQKLALFSMENPVSESGSPPQSPGTGLPSSPSPFLNPSHSIPSLHADIWNANKNFERLFNALLQFLEPTKSEEEIEYGLILLWEMLENQGPYLEGRESDLFSVLLRVRYCNKLNVLEATNTIRDALTANIEPVYGLTTMHASLRTFRTEPHPASSDEDVKSTAYAFGLIALGKFILRLPGEIAEEELPRLKGTLISSLNDKTSLIVRESAAASIIAAQLVLRDETHLFALLDGLADEKKNLLTYLFDKHGARGLTAATGSSGMDKLEKEIRRLDTRTSTPSRPTAAAAPAPAPSLVARQMTSVQFEFQYDADGNMLSDESGRSLSYDGHLPFVMINQ
ncbi:clasp N terminal-domain-containing protein [Lyophyllum atratum]|nr:clasp N terminal-domain-containing protein [Lyophyllum atratum]